MTVTTNHARPVTVRRLHPADHADWARLWSGYLAHHDEAMPDAQVRHTFDRLCAGEALHGFVAEVGGRVSGFVHCLFHPSTWTPTDYCYLQDLFVDASSRRGGVGRALIATVVDFARDRGANRVIWLTNEDNVAARSLYDAVARRTGLIQYRIDPD